jgi:serine/threonine protein kinase
MEIHIHRKINSIQPPAGRRYQNLIEHKGYRLMMRQRRHRIYLAYHEGRSLWDTVEYSSRRRPFPPLRRDRHGRYPDIVSEYFIWRVFQALVNACQVLHFGQISDAPGVRADWKPITHLDIKPDNVFLDTRWNDDGTIAVSTSPQCPNTTSNHPSQTTNFVLADFGLSIHPMELAQNPQAAAAIGLNYGNENPDQYVIDSDDTPMYYAPVSSDRYADIFGSSRTGASIRFSKPALPTQRKDGHLADVSAQVESNNIKLTAPSGASIWYLMANGQPGSHHGPQLVMTDGRSFEFVADKDYNIREDPDPWPPGNFPTIATYSAELRDLMRHCLEWDEPDRPGLIDLKNIIDPWLDGRANPGPGSVQFFDSPEFRIGARRPARR